MLKTMRHSLAALIVALASNAGCASVAVAQQAAPFPGAVQLSPGQWVPCSHPIAVEAGRGCGATLPAPAPGPTAAPVCDPRPNPYLEADRAAACAAWAVTHDTAPPLPTFVVGDVYQDPYLVRVVVLAVSRSLEGVPVVTVEYIAPRPGRVASFRIDDVNAQRWARVP